jgi:hypothetical protein
VHPRLRSVVQASENEMRELQRATRNRDRYWRIYFALARDRF